MKRFNLNYIFWALIIAIAINTIQETKATTENPLIIVYDNSLQRYVDTYNITIYNKTGGYYSSYETNGSVTNLYNPISNSTTNTAYTLLAYYSFQNYTLITTSINFDVTCSNPAGYACYYKVNITYHDDSTYESTEAILPSGSSTTYSLIEYNTSKPIKEIRYYSKKSAGGVTSTISSTTFYSIHNNSIARPTVTNDNYTIYLNTTNYLIANISTNITNNTAYYMTTYQTNTVSISYYDEITGAIINTTTVNTYLTGSVISYNKTTTNGTVIFTLVQPQTYDIIYNANNYNQRNYIYTLSNGSSTNLRLYLRPTVNSSSVLFTILDQNNDYVQNAIVYSRIKNLSGTNYITVEMCRTDILGQCLISADVSTTTYIATTTYNFLVTYNNTDVGSSGDTVLSSNTYIMKVNVASSPLINYFELNKIQYTNISLGSDIFTITVYDPYNNIDEVCLYSYRSTGSITTLTNTSCDTGNPVTLNVYSNTSLGSENWAEAVITYDGNSYLLTQYTGIINNDGGSELPIAYLIFVFLGVVITVALGTKSLATTSIVALGGISFILLRLSDNILPKIAVIGLLGAAAIIYMRMKE